MLILQSVGVQPSDVVPHMLQQLSLVENQNFAKTIRSILIAHDNGSKIVSATELCTVTIS